MDEQKLFVHTWGMEPGFMFHHLWTGLRFFCAEREPTADDPDHWDCYVFGDQSDPLVILNAETVNMEPEAYVDYLARTSMEMADKAKAKQRAGRSWRGR